MNLKKALETIEYIEVLNDSIITSIKQYLTANPTSIIDKEWLTQDYKKRIADFCDKTFDVTNNDYWVTYDKCKHLRICLDEGKIIAKITVSSYDPIYSPYGYTKEYYNLFKVEVELPESMLELVQSYIMNGLKEHYNELYKQKEELKKSNWIKKQILKL